MPETGELTIGPLHAQGAVLDFLQQLAHATGDARQSLTGVFMVSEALYGATHLLVFLNGSQILREAWVWCRT
jgi:hypothetical protein